MLCSKKRHSVTTYEYARSSLQTLHTLSKNVKETQARSAVTITFKASAEVAATSLTLPYIRFIHSMKSVGMLHDQCGQTYECTSVPTRSAQIFLQCTGRVSLGVFREAGSYPHGILYRESFISVKGCTPFCQPLTKVAPLPSQGFICLNCTMLAEEHLHTPSPFRADSPHPPSSRNPPSPSREGYKEPGKDGGQLPTAQIPVPAPQLLQKQLGVCLGHGSSSAHLTAGQRREKLPPAIPAASAPGVKKGAGPHAL